MALQDLRHVPQPLRGRGRRSVWQPLGKVLRPDAAMCAWLLERGSLTARLQQHYGPISVQVLRQGVMCPLPDEARPGQRQVMGRDVVLVSKTQGILVLAHSVALPGARGALPVMLRRLGRQALGSVLFTRPGFVRRQREWALLDARHPLHQAAQRVLSAPVPARFWARRATFSPCRQPKQVVQVTEVFLGA